MHYFNLICRVDRLLQPLLCCAILLSSTALYGAPADDIERQQSRIQREQQQRIEQERRELLDRRGHESIEFTAPEAPASLGGPCFEVHQIALKGADQMSLDVQGIITAPYIDQCLGLDKINLLMRDVTEWYFDKGFVTSRAYVTGQDLATGKLSLTIVEGRIESITATDADTRVSMATAFPHMKGRLLNLRDIEQGIEQLNRLQSVNAKMDLLPGSEPGQSAISVNAETRQAWQVRLTRDNSGQASTGEYLNSLLFSLDNPLGLNDYFYLSAQQDTAHSSEGKLSESLSAHWDMPYGYWSLGLDISYFRYLSTIASFTGTFESSGTSLSHTLNLDRVLYRDNDSKLSVGFKIKHRDSRNFIEDVELASSRSLGSAGLGLSYEKFFESQLNFLATFDYDHGLRAFGAPDDDDQISGGPQAQFEKYSLGFDLQKKMDVTLFNQSVGLLLQSSLQLQYSPDPLYSSEQTSIGSLYNVRGYKGSSIAADSGGYLRNTLNLQWQPNWGGYWPKRIDTSVGIDIGVIRDRQQFYSNDKFSRLKGWAIGLALVADHYTINIVYARPINAPAFIQAAQEQWHFAISFSI